MTDDDQTTNVNKNRINLPIDLRVFSLLLLAVIVGMLLIWRPWSNTEGNGRTIKVTGETTVKAEPDEFIFNPTYQIQNANQAAALAEVTRKTNEVVDGLKKLGVEDSDIKTDASGYDFPVYSGRGPEQTTYSSRLTVTADNKEMAQKVQDYLATTVPTGSVSPQATFSKEKRRELENKARDEATKEARTKADQSAENLGFEIGKVKSVEDGAGFGDVMPFEANAMTDSASTRSLAVQPGQNDFNYSVTVTYYLR